VARRNNDEPSTMTEQVETPYGTYAITYQTGPGYQMTTTEVDQGVVMETVNVRLLNNQKSFYGDEKHPFFFKDFPYDLTQLRNLSNPRVRLNTGGPGEPLEMLNKPPPNVPMIELMGKEDEEKNLNWAKALFSMRPVDAEGNYLVVLKVFDGEKNCVLRRRDVLIKPNGMRASVNMFKSIKTSNPEARYQIINQLIPPLDAASNPRGRRTRSSSHRRG
jgi:hypothetical protein